MPELPEVETIRCGLQKKLVGQKIESVIIRETRMRVPVDERKLFSELPGQTFLEIGRRSKYLLLHLTKDKILMVHLGMSGRVVLQATDEDFRKHDHIILNLVGGQQFRFHDPRRFGLVELVDASKLQQHVRIKNLGLEPLDNTTTSEVTWIKISTSKKPIKSLLMDANFIVGVGNIYANEALFLAGIHPGKIANSLTRKEWDLLLHQVKLVLHKAIEQGGTTLNDFVNSSGEMGYFQQELAVYGREGAACKRCNHEILRIVQSGRSSFYCPHCQKI